MGEGALRGSGLVRHARERLHDVDAHRARVQLADGEVVEVEGALGARLGEPRCPEGRGRGDSAAAAVEVRRGGWREEGCRRGGLRGGEGRTDSGRPGARGPGRERGRGAPGPRQCTGRGARGREERGPSPRYPGTPEAPEVQWPSKPSRRSL